MKITNIPGFTAESAIGSFTNITYRTTTRYSSATSASILPQYITCVNYCDATGYCGYQECTITGDYPGETGPTGPVDKPDSACGRCKVSCLGKPAGPVRKACLDNCNAEVC